VSGRRAAGKAGQFAEPLTDGDGSGGSGGLSRSSQRRSRQQRRRKMMKIIGMSTAGVLVVAGAGMGYVYVHLSGNIKSSKLFDGNQAAAVGVEKPDAFGRTPLNVLLIGSDTRDTSEDAALGGDAGPGAHADVEMLVHLSADRSNITVMSIPRDTVTELPSCAGYDSPQIITDSLQAGPYCTAEAVHKLTGITVDDFAVVDFSGVVNISNALGGVNVCVSSNVYDIYSGLKLTAGTHSLKGLAALQFLRTRHAFGDGSDNIGRTTATHIFFTDMINKLKSANTLANPVAMYGIADAATKALTVSPGLNSVPKLLSLAADMNKVPTDRITFTTMQNVAYSGTNSSLDADVQEDTSLAPTLFNAIRNDQSLTSASGAQTGAGTVTKSATPAPPVSSITVAVYNGTSVTGRENDIAGVLTGEGFNPATAGYPDSASPATTTLTYGPGQAAQAQETAKVLGLPSSALKQGTQSGLKLVIGADWTSGNAFPHSTPSAAPVNTAQALASSLSQNASDSKCVQVTTAYTEPGNTPQSEFANHPNVPNSAP
jgi:LCP family protein required for cell wall assembly